MKREDAVRRLADCREELRERFGVESLTLFGSVARGDEGRESDVDILVEFASPPGFDGYMDLKFHLEELLGTPVDLVMKTALRREAASVLAEEGIRVA